MPSPIVQNLKLASANPPITRNLTGSSSSSDSPQETDASRKSSMAERAASATLSGPTRSLMRVPSMTMMGGRTQQVNAKFEPANGRHSLSSHNDVINVALSNILSSSNSHR